MKLYTLNEVQIDLTIKFGTDDKAYEEYLQKTILAAIDGVFISGWSTKFSVPNSAELSLTVTHGVPVDTDQTNKLINCINRSTGWRLPLINWMTETRKKQRTDFCGNPCSEVFITVNSQEQADAINSLSKEEVSIGAADPKK